jgi:tetratricopeptide (TPR) repeat protein
MKDRKHIEEKLKRAASRRRWREAWTGLWKGFFWGALLWLTTLITFKLLPIPFFTLGWAGMAWGGFALARFVWPLLKPINLAETAQWVDEQCGLKERFTAALEFDGKEEWGGFIMKDAQQFLDRVHPKSLIAFNLPSLAKWSVMVLALSAGLGFVPEYRTEAYLQEKKEKAHIKSSGEHLVKFIRQEIKERPPALQPTETAMQKVDELGTKLSKAKLTRDNALKDIASVTEMLKKEHTSLDQNPALKRMQKAARQPNGSAPSETMSAMQKKMEDLKRQLGEKMASQAAMQEMQRKLDALQKAVQGMQDSEGGMSEQMKQSLAQQLSDMAQQAAQMGLNSEQIEAALNNLKAGDIEKLLKDLNQAQVDLDKMLQMAKQLQNLQMQMSQIGKDLAEQLEKGQAMFAKQNLLEKAKQLQSGELSQEDLEKMLKELQKAIPEAADYGKVQDFLKQADQQLKNGQKAEAAKSLMAAAEELQKLMDQYGDMQSLMASLDNLMKASMCVGNCMGWGQCSSPGFKPGSKPGQGVGTWGEEGGDFMYRDPGQASFDNSGIERPDMDGRGHTNRGEGELAPGLTPTKVKGQFNPGAPMPSITLRGLSIKGQSEVEFTETVTSAQTDAESALSQQRVPRAYQNSVRDYFNDLKQ